MSPAEIAYGTLIIAAFAFFTTCMIYASRH
jgi:hypothetical protein